MPLPKEELHKIIHTLTKHLAPYTRNIQGFLVADEPYLNGINKKELENVLLALDESFKNTTLNQKPLWINFAGAMFNSEFAKRVNQKLTEYVWHIDQYYLHQNQLAHSFSDEQLQAFENWKKTIQANKLVSYDQANNIHQKGGLPNGIDIVSFDFYISTLLFDDMYSEAINWFETLNHSHACQPFKGQSQDAINAQLSFIQNGLVDPQLEHDKKQLDQLFNCRMQTTLALLQQQINVDFSENLAPKILMVAESSSNAFFERDENHLIEESQPLKLVEHRAYNEAKRYLDLHKANQEAFNAGIAFFLYPDAYDHSIKLSIKGAEGLPSVKHLIKTYSQKLEPN